MRPEGAAEIMKNVEDVTRMLAGSLADADLDRLVDDLRRLPANPSGRGRLAAALLVRLAGEPTGATHRLRHLDVLLALADQDPPPTPEWPRQRAAARALAIGHAVRNRTVADYGAWIAELDDLTEAYGDDVALRGLFTSTRTGVVMLQAMATGDEAVLRRLPTELQAVRDLGHRHPLLAELSALIDVSISGMRAHQTGDTAGAFAALDQLRAMTDQSPAGHMMRGVMDETAAMLAPFRRMLAAEATGSTYALSDEELAAVVELAQRVDASASDRALNHVSAGGALLAMGQESDPERVDIAIGHLRQALELAGADNQNRAFYLQSLALGLCRRAEVRGGTAGLDEALTVLDEAELLIGGPQHPQWNLLCELRAGVLRRLGKNRAGRRAAMEGLRGYAWRALVQADTAAAKIAIQGAVRDATDLARQCLTDNSLEDALQALDAGRGLLLFAASSLRDVAAQLDAAGRAELAGRWRTAGSSGTSEEKFTQLRREVVAALSADETAMARLLDPPSLTEIRSALRAIEADALIYLVPGASGGEQTMPGLAVIAPVEGPPSHMVLPDLMLDEEVDVERYLTALARRDLSPPEAHEDFADRLDAVCDWAWRAAMGPVIDQYLGTRATSEPARVPRVVLVPMGDLARIPWPAARRRDGTYAVQLAAFSQTTSARMLCEAASRAAAPLAPVGLVVADPDTAGRAQPLLAARREAHAVHQAFYRGGRYVGRRPDGSTSRSGGGTPDDVRAWLTSSSPAAGAMLHLACHGDVVLDAEAPRSMLLLAEEGGGELDAEELVGVMAGARQRAVDLVVLAACRTGTSIHGYDEAYSMGTAFLAGGARSVLSTQWAIPDVATSSLMFMFHYYLRRHQLPAWRALRQAQLWMLDPHRKAPPEMPAEMRPQASATDNAQVVSWAGFVHWGR